MTAVVRYFAAAAEAAGTTETSHAGTTLGEILDAAEAMHGRPFAKVLARCSVLVDGVLTEDRATEVTSGAVIDVLPPFAGG